MGFWHTGYIDFHQPVGLDDYQIAPSPVEYKCPQCGMVFDSYEQLWDHKLESHPAKRPSITIKGQEVVDAPVCITSCLQPNDIAITNCSKASINKEPISPDLLPEVLAEIKTGDYHLYLANDGIGSEHKLEFRIASSSDLSGIESEFTEMAKRQLLNLTSIEEFISATSSYQSAIGYCDGICAYLYGVMAREQHPESSLSYKDYEVKFNQASHKLRDYDRPLARVINGLISFHFNHFEETVCCVAHSRVGLVARLFNSWITCVDPNKSIFQTPNVERGWMEKYVTDWDTERIVEWSSQSLDELAERTEELEEFLTGNASNYDMVKVHILLSEIYFQINDCQKSILHAKSLRNMPGMECWVECMINKNIEGKDDKK